MIKTKITLSHYKRASTHASTETKQNGVAKSATCLISLFNFFLKICPAPKYKLIIAAIQQQWTIHLIKS